MKFIVDPIEIAVNGYSDDKFCFGFSCNCYSKSECKAKASTPCQAKADVQ